MLRISRDLYVRDTKLECYYIRICPNGKKTYRIQANLDVLGRNIVIKLCELHKALILKYYSHLNFDNVICNKVVLFPKKTAFLL